MSAFGTYDDCEACGCHLCRENQVKVYGETKCKPCIDCVGMHHSEISEDEVGYYCVNEACPDPISKVCNKKN